MNPDLMVALFILILLLGAGLIFLTLLILKALFEAINPYLQAFFENPSCCFGSLAILAIIVLAASYFLSKIILRT